MSNGTFASVKLDGVSARKIKQHLESIGIKDSIPVDEMHITLMYSRDSVVKGNPEPNAIYRARNIGKPTIIGNDPWRAIVLDVSSPELGKRHAELRSMGGVHSYDNYRPHLSLKYSPSDDDLVKLIENPLPTMELMFTGESFKPCKVTNNDNVPTMDYVRQCGSQWCVFSKSGKKLGTHPTKEKADEQLRAIEANKNAP